MTSLGWAKNTQVMKPNSESPKAATSAVCFVGCDERLLRMRASC